MKIIRHSHEELTIRDRPGLFTSCFMLVWSCFFIGIPGLLWVSAMAGMGATRLVCQRVEPEQLGCNLSQTQYFGFISKPEQRFNQVLEAKFNQTEGRDSEGDNIQDNWVSLVTSKGDFTLFEDPIRYNGTRGSANDMWDLADEINGYIQAGVDSFTVTRDLRFSLFQMLVPTLFSSVFLLIGLGVVYWVFQIRWTRFDLNSETLVWKRYSLLGVRSVELPLAEIQAITLDTEHHYDGPSTYTLKVKIHSDRLLMGRTYQSQQARDIKATISNLLLDVNGDFR